jgi:hypothetical protein
VEREKAWKREKAWESVEKAWTPTNGERGKAWRKRGGESVDTHKNKKTSGQIENVAAFVGLCV